MNISLRVWHSWMACCGLDGIGFMIDEGGHKYITLVQTLEALTCATFYLQFLVIVACQYYFKEYLS